MKNFIRFTLTSLPFVIGLILCLTSFTYLIRFTADSYDEYNNLATFVALAIIGFPVLLYGIYKLSSERS